MTPQHDDDRDRRLHDHLDREPHGADDRLADRPLEDDELLRRSVTTLRAMQEWLRESRPPAPPSLARAVIEQIEASAEIDNQTAGYCTGSCPVRGAEAISVSLTEVQVACR